MKQTVRTMTVMLVALMVAGCAQDKKKSFVEATPIEAEVTDRTVGDLCELLGYQPVKVQGYTLVWGLAGTGSSDCPPGIRQALVELIKKTEAQKYMSAPYNRMSTDELINSQDTAAVLVSGDVPPGGSRGTRFNVQMRIPWSSQTTSLQGGTMIPTDLREVVMGERAPIVGPLSAQAIGPVYTDPIAGITQKPGDAQLLQGMVLGGGRSLKDRRVQLALVDPDYRVALHLQRRINARFISTDGKPVANSLDRSRIEIQVPQQNRDNYEHFFRVLQALYFRDDLIFQRQKLQELSDRALKPDTDMDQLALEWEAIGKPSIGALEIYYADSSRPLAYFAARTALNLGHTEAVDAMLKIASDKTHPHRIEAIEYLGTMAGNVRANQALVRLLDDDQTKIRLLAYEGLRLAVDPRIRVYPMPGGFKLETVETMGKPLIYIWADIDPRIILFGKNLVANRNAFYETPGKQLTINAGPGDTRFTLIRMLPGGERHIQLTCSMTLEGLISALARPCEQPGNPGAGMTFSQIAAIIEDLCERSVLPVEYHLHNWTSLHGETAAAGGGNSPAPR